MAIYAWPFMAFKSDFAGPLPEWSNFEGISFAGKNWLIAQMRHREALYSPYPYQLFSINTQTSQTKHLNKQSISGFHYVDVIPEWALDRTFKYDRRSVKLDLFKPAEGIQFLDTPLTLGAIANLRDPSSPSKQVELDAGDNAEP